ncbi:MAG: prolyl oligopeptidase family serine peptidase [Fuerstiella sp.]|nr:prolyl oligopeptidase family serine peptidase [Fuerstiella sp.]MCP4856609.1 prolyl oligopeptidase family serine peptidase [Fuerstiella sp.]
MKTYLGCWGVYDFTDNNESLFPDQVARENFGLSSDKQAHAASAFHNLRTPPPISLLIHGGKDILTHASQSIRFGEQIQAKGGAAEVIIFPAHNHNFVNPNNPVAFKKAILAIANLYRRGFQLDNADFTRLEKELDNLLSNYFPADQIKMEQLLGKWEGKTETILLLKEGEAQLVNNRGKPLRATYQNHGATFDIVSDGNSKRFYLRQDGRVIFSITQEGRHAGRKEIYTRRK